MGNVLIAMPKPEDSHHIERLIRSHGMLVDTEVCTSGAEILRIANDRDCGVVICTRRLRDMSFSDLAEYLPTSFGIIVLTSDVSFETFSDRTIKLLMPFRNGELISTVEMMSMRTYKRERKKKTERPPRERSEKEKQIIDSAKLILIDKHGMSEPEAFRYIQKTSMDTGRTTVETAEMILLLNQTTG